MVIPTLFGNKLKHRARDKFTITLSEIIFQHKINFRTGGSVSESELSRLLNLHGKKGKIFLANKPYESPAEPFCLRQLTDESGNQKKLNLRITPQLANSDVVLVPYELAYWYKDKSYIIYLNSLSKQKKLIILNTADYISKIKKIKNAIYLRTFLNPGEHSRDTVIIPYEINPLINARSFNPKFNISFMGYFPKVFSSRIFYALKNSFRYPVQGNGAIIRKLMARKLRETNLPHTLVVRHSFGGWKRDKSENALKRRWEFLNSVSESRYVICPRGDGNQSLRFYEALSAGRVPILIDTKIKLPLEDQLDYNKFIITVKINDSTMIWRKKILNFESLYNETTFKLLSKEISEFYDQNLSMYNFYRNLFIDFLAEI